MFLQNQFLILQVHFFNDKISLPGLHTCVFDNISLGASIYFIFVSKSEFFINHESFFN